MRRESLQFGAQQYCASRYPWRQSKGSLWTAVTGQVTCRLPQRHVMSVGSAKLACVRIRRSHDVFLDSLTGVCGTDIAAHFQLVGGAVQCVDCDAQRHLCSCTCLPCPKNMSAADNGMLPAILGNLAK